MNRQIQIELWPECRCNRCKFCNLVLSSELRGDGKQANPNILLSPSKKEVFIDRAIKFTYDVDWSQYDMLLIRGGEVFNDYDISIVPKYKTFLKRISELVENGTVQKVFLVTSLKYPYEQSLLKLTLDEFENNNINIQEKVLIGTSWDIKYRFTEKSLEWWKNNVSILDSLSVPIHITSILTQSFIDRFFKNDKNVLNVMSRNFDFIAAQGKPELLFLDGFFPKRKDCMNFLLHLKNSEYNPIWYRLLHQNYRRAESIFFTEYDRLQVRDLETYKVVFDEENQEVLKCGHPKEYANYVDSDACFINCTVRPLHLGRGYKVPCR